MLLGPIQAPRGHRAWEVQVPDGWCSGIVLAEMRMVLSVTVEAIRKIRVSCLKRLRESAGH